VERLQEETPKRDTQSASPDITYLLANADTDSEAICLAALELPEFF
jgi:hypothetical protein